MEKLTTAWKAIVLRGLLPIAFLMPMTWLASCDDDDDNSERKESIEFYADPSDEEPLSTLHVDVRGGLVSVYVKTNVDFTATWQDSYTSASTEPWATVEDYSQTDDSGFRIVTLNFEPRSTSATYTSRSGQLILNAVDTSLDFNAFITVYQGMTSRISQAFSWLLYGKVDPRITDGETPISDWTATQLSYGYTSSDEDYCFGKYGFVKLGDDDGHGSDLITPTVSSYNYDSLLVVSFNAVAYTDYITGELDENTLTVEVDGGGVIADYASTNGRSIAIEIGNFDPSSEDFPDDMWDDTNYLVFITSTSAYPISQSTQIYFKSTPSSGNSRIYIDNIYVYRYTDLQPDYFEDNGGSGKDIILGSSEED